MQQMVIGKSGALSKPVWRLTLTRCILALGLMLTAAAPLTANAQGYVDAADWKEVDVPPPPAFDMAKLLTFEVTLGDRKSVV